MQSCLDPATVLAKCYGKHAQISQGAHCRFGLNGRSLILQAAQRAAKKPRLCQGALGVSPSFSSTSDAAKSRKNTSAATPHQIDGAKFMSHAAVGEALSDQQKHQKQSPVMRQPTPGQHSSEFASHPETSQAAGTAQPMPAEEGQAGASPLGYSTAPSTAQANALIEGLDPHDQPLVVYINRSSVPRILRQVCTLPCSSRKRLPSARGMHHSACYAAESASWPWRLARQPDELQLLR